LYTGGHTKGEESILHLQVKRPCPKQLGVMHLITKADQSRTKKKEETAKGFRKPYLQVWEMETMVGGRGHRSKEKQERDRWAKRIHGLLAPNRPNGTNPRTNEAERLGCLLGERFGARKGLCTAKCTREGDGCAVYPSEPVKGRGA